MVLSLLLIHPHLLFPVDFQAKLWIRCCEALIVLSFRSCRFEAECFYFSSSFLLLCFIFITLLHPKMKKSFHLQQFSSHTFFNCNSPVSPPSGFSSHLSSPLPHILPLVAVIFSLLLTFPPLLSLSYSSALLDLSEFVGSFLSLWIPPHQPPLPFNLSS